MKETMLIFASLCVLLASVMEGVNAEICDDVNMTVQNACRDMLGLGQFYCLQPTIVRERQTEAGCMPNGTVVVPCFAAPNVSCGGLLFNGTECTFTEERSCRYVELCMGGRPCYSYRVAVALSLFLGMLGIDRFYLGYPAIGLVKLCTLGFMFVGHLVDFLLILVQAVGPADRSSYYSPFYGPIHYNVNSTDPYLPISDQCA